MHHHLYFPADRIGFYGERCTGNLLSDASCGCNMTLTFTNVYFQRPGPTKILRGRAFNKVSATSVCIHTICHLSGGNDLIHNLKLVSPRCTVFMGSTHRFCSTWDPPWSFPIPRASAHGSKAIPCSSQPIVSCITEQLDPWHYTSSQKRRLINEWYSFESWIIINRSID